MFLHNTVDRRKAYILKSGKLKTNNIHYPDFHFLDENIKGLTLEIQVTYQLKMIMSDLQQYPLNIYLIKNVVAIVVFLQPGKCLLLTISFIFSKAEIRKLICRERIAIITLQKEKY